MRKEAVCVYQQCKIYRVDLNNLTKSQWQAMNEEILKCKMFRSYWEKNSLPVSVGAVSVCGK